MLVKTGILTRQKRLHKIGRHLTEGHDDAVLAMHAAQQHALRIQHHGALRHLTEFRQIILTGEMRVITQRHRQG